MHILFILFTLFFPFSAAAHGDRPSLETETGGYLIDIGYDREGLRPGEEVTFDFDLITAGNRPAFVPFTAIDIRLTKGSSTILERSLPNEQKYIPTLSVTFPAAGEYDLHVAYVQTGAVIASETFDLTVLENAGILARAENTLHYVIAVALLALSVFAVVSSYRMRS